MSFCRVGTVNLIVEKGKILLAKRSKLSFVYPGMWCLVGGFVDYGEKAEDGVRREAMEEAGVEVEVIRFSGHYYNSPSPTQKNVITLPFYTQIKSGKPHASQPEEVSEVKWFLPQEIRKMELMKSHKEILEAEGLI